MSVFKHKKIAEKANILFLALSLGISGVTAAGIAYIYELSKGQQEAYEENTAIRNTASAVSVADQGAAKSAGRIVLGAATPDIAAVENYYGEASHYHEAMSDGMQQLEGLVTDPEIQAIFPGLEKDEKVLREMTESLYRLGKVHNVVDAKKIYEGTYYPLSNTVQDQVQAMQYQAGQQADENMVQLQKLRHSLYGLLGGSLLVWLLAMYLLQWHIIQSFKRRIQDLYEHITALHNGQSEDMQNENSPDEYGDFVQPLHDMDQLLDSYIRDIQTYAASIHADQFVYEHDETIHYPGRFAGIQSSLESISMHLVQTADNLHEKCDTVIDHMGELRDRGKLLHAGQHDQEINATELMETLKQLRDTAGIYSQQIVAAERYCRNMNGHIAGTRREMAGLTEDAGQIQDVAGQLTNRISGVETLAHQLNLLAVDAAIEAKRVDFSSRSGLVSMTKRIQDIAADLSQIHIRTVKLLTQMETLLEQSGEQHGVLKNRLEKMQAGMVAMTEAMAVQTATSQQQYVMLTQAVQQGDSMHKLILESTAIAEDNDQAGEKLLKEIRVLAAQLPSGIDNRPDSAVTDKKKTRS